MRVGYPPGDRPNPVARRRARSFKKSLHRPSRANYGSPQPCGVVLLARLRPVAPAVTPHGSLVGWVVLAAVLAIVVVGGVVLTSRR